MQSVIICEIIVRLLVILQNKKVKIKGCIFLRNASITYQITWSYIAFLTLNLTLTSSALRSTEQVRGMTSKHGGSCYAVRTLREQGLLPVRNKDCPAAARSAALPDNGFLSSIFLSDHLSIHRFSAFPRPSQVSVTRNYLNVFSNAHIFTNDSSVIQDGA